MLVELYREEKRGGGWWRNLYIALGALVVLRHVT